MSSLADEAEDDIVADVTVVVAVVVVVAKAEAAVVKDSS